MNLFKKLISSACAFAMLASMAVAVQAAGTLPQDLEESKRPVMNVAFKKADDFETSGKGKLVFSLGNLTKFFAAFGGNDKKIVLAQAVVVLPEDQFDVSRYEKYEEVWNEDWTERVSENSANSVVTTVVPANGDNDKANPTNYGGTFTRTPWYKTAGENISTGVAEAINIVTNSATTLTNSVGDTCDLWSVDVQLKTENGTVVPHDEITVDVRFAKIGYVFKGGQNVLADGTFISEVDAEQVGVLPSLTVNKATIPAQQGTGSGEEPGDTDYTPEISGTDMDTVYEGTEEHANDNKFAVAKHIEFSATDKGDNTHVRWFVKVNNDKTWYNDYEIPTINADGVTYKMGLVVGYEGELPVEILGADLVVPSQN